MSEYKTKAVLVVDEFIRKNNLVQKDVAKQANLRPATVSEMVGKRRQSVSIEHLEKLASTYNIKNMNDLLTLRQERD